MTVRAEEPVVETVQEFFRTEAGTGALLVFCACVALGAANSPWADLYHRLWATPIVIAGGAHALSLTLHPWIDDGLMAVFLLLVGLEIKREVLAGELASPRQAALPIAGALGGMVMTRLQSISWPERGRHRGTRMGDSHGDRHRVRARDPGAGRTSRAGWTRNCLRRPGHRGRYGGVLAIALV